MRKYIISLVAISALVLFGAACSKTPTQQTLPTPNSSTGSAENIFSPITSVKYSSDLSIEDGYKIILPYVKKWAQDAYLIKYFSSIITSNYNYKANYYSFISLSSQKTLEVTYNRKLNSEYLISDPRSFKSINIFNIREVYWKDDFDSKKQSKEEWDASVLYQKKIVSRGSFNNLDNFLSSTKMIELAQKDGLSDFIDKYKGLTITHNEINLVDYENGDTEWMIMLSMGNFEPLKISRTFAARYNATNGNLINKVIK